MSVEMQEAKQRNMYWQCVRGICIVLVVLIHSNNGIPFLGSDHSWNFDYWLVLRQAINFPVAVFIFLSGYFTNIERVSSGSDLPAILIKRITRLYLPFLVWALIYGVTKNIIGGFSSNIFKEVAKVFLGLTSGQLYFILVLIQLTVISPILVWTIKENKFVKLMLSVSSIYLALLYIYSFVVGRQFQFYQTLFPAWFIFYYVGLYVKIKGLPVLFRTHILRNSIMLVVAALGLSIIESYLIFRSGLSVAFASSQIKFSSFFYSLAVINLLFAIERLQLVRESKFLLLLGDNSYGIYYVHMLWILVTSKALSFVLPTSNFLPLFQFVQVTLVVFFSLVSIGITKKVIGSRLANRFLGF